MSHDTRRRVILVMAALIVVALVLASTGCTSSDASSDEGTGDSADGPELNGALYAESMNAICATTTERLARLPTPPAEISRADWAGEVSRALSAEATAFDEIRVGESRRDDHASFIENTEDQVAAWQALGDALAAEGADDDAVGDLATEIAELTLGRNDLANEMELTGCQARDLS